MYNPKPIDTSNIELPKELNDLIEHLAENNHDIWASQRIKEGWTFGPKREMIKSFILILCLTMNCLNLKRSMTGKHRLKLLRQ